MQKIFDKPTERWTKTIYQIQTANKNSYVLKNVETQTILKATTKPQDLQLISGDPQKPEKQIKDADHTRDQIKKQNISKLHKQLSNDTKNIITSKRTRKTNSKYKDFV